jgi:truncated hemoglobin YjbI
MFKAFMRLFGGGAAQAKAQGSLYDRIGGEAAVNAAVDVFYRKVLKDKRINQFFEGVDMDKQAGKQKAFLTMAFGGPNKYTGEDMRKGHAHLVERGLNNSHFDAVLENLGATLKELGVADNLIKEAAAIAESTRKDVLAGYTAEEKAAKSKTLYERIGGEAAVNAAVDVFYRKVLKDKRINQFFEGVDMDKQAGKQKAFLTMAFGGPNKYTGEDMRKGHAHLVERGLNNSHFDAVLENLGATLKELGVADNLIAEAAAIAESTRKDVLAGFTAEEKAAKGKSLYERIGGEAAVNAAVDVFYRKVLKDKRINQFFEGVDMDKQAAKQKAFLTMAFGGPHKYTGEDMRKGHAHLVARGLNDSHFDAVLENLGATLKELGVADNLIKEAAAIAESTRNDVLGR